MAADGFTELVLPPGLTTASAERCLSLLSRTPEELSWRVFPLGAEDAVDERRRVTPLEEELLRLELERLLFTDDELLSEDLRPTEDLLSEDDLLLSTEEFPLSTEDLRREEELFTEDDLLLLSEEDEERTVLPDFPDEERLLEEEDDDELLREELLSEEDLRVVVVVLLPLSLRV